MESRFENDCGFCFCFVFTAIFRSLLYEACGRIVNPIYGSVGLMWSGSWQLCQAAVEAVLKGAPITPINSEAAENGHGPPFKAYDIRHVSKDENSAASNDSNRVRTRCRVKRVVKPKPCKPAAAAGGGFCSAVIDSTKDELTRSTSHDSSVSHQSELAIVDGESKETDESMVSVETAEASLLFRAEPESATKSKEGAHDVDTCTEMSGVGLELTLGFQPVSRAHHVVPVKKRRIEACGSCDADTCKMELGLDYSA